MINIILIVLSALVLLFLVFEIGYWLGRAQGVRDMRPPKSRKSDD